MRASIRNISKKNMQMQVTTNELFPLDFYAAELLALEHKKSFISANGTTRSNKNVIKIKIDFHMNYEVPESNVWCTSCKKSNSMSIQHAKTKEKMYLFIFVWLRS